MAPCLGGTALWCDHASELLQDQASATSVWLLSCPPAALHGSWRCPDPCGGFALREPGLGHLVCLKLASSLCMHVTFQTASSRIQGVPLASPGAPGALGPEALVVRPVSCFLGSLPAACLHSHGETAPVWPGGSPQKAWQTPTDGFRPMALCPSQQGLRPEPEDMGLPGRRSGLRCGRSAELSPWSWPARPTLSPVPALCAGPTGSDRRGGGLAARPAGPVFLLPQADPSTA